ncbi:MAG: PIN domain-containing protein [Thermoproteota archaeon]
MEEYKKWALKFGSEKPALKEQASILYILLKDRIKLYEPERGEVNACKPYFQDEYADLYHAATCLKANATLITNDKHFDRIKQVGLVKVISTSEALKKIL